MNCVMRTVVVALGLGALVHLSGCSNPGPVTPDPQAAPQLAPVCVPESAPTPPGYARQSIAYPTGNPATSTVFLERTSPEQVLSGESFDYEIRVTNITTLRIAEVVVTDKLSAQLKIDSSVPAVTETSGTTARWFLDTLDPCETKTIKISCTADQTGSLAAFTTVDHSILLPSTSTSIRPHLSLALAVPTQVLIGDTFEIIPTVTNRGTGAAPRVTVQYTPPAGLTVVQGNPTWDVESLAQGESRALPPVTLRADLAGQHSHEATASAELTNGTVDTKADSVAMEVVAPKLEVGLQGPDRFPIQRPCRIECTVTNSGNGVAHHPLLTLEIPAGVTVESTDGGVASAGKIQWDLGELAPATSRTIAMVLRSDAVNTATLTLKAENPVAAPVTAVHQTEFHGIPTMEVEISNYPMGPIVVGTEETYTISVRNHGSAKLTEVNLVCRLDDSISFSSYTGPTGPEGDAGADAKILKFSPLVRLDPDPRKRHSWRIKVRTEKPGVSLFNAVVSSKELGSVQRDVKINIIP